MAEHLDPAKKRKTIDSKPTTPDFLRILVGDADPAVWSSRRKLVVQSATDITMKNTFQEPVAPTFSKRLDDAAIKYRQRSVPAFPLLVISGLHATMPQPHA